MILRLSDGRYFDPSHLLEEALANGFPVEGSRFDQVVDEKAAATPEQARHDRGRLEFPGGPGSGPPTEIGPPDQAGGP